MTVYAVLTAVQSEEQGQPPPWPLLLPSANGCGHFIVQVSERHHKGALGGGGGGGRHWERRTHIQWTTL